MFLIFSAQNRAVFQHPKANKAAHIEELVRKESLKTILLPIQNQQKHFQKKQ